MPPQAVAMKEPIALECPSHSELMLRRQIALLEEKTKALEIENAHLRRQTDEASQLTKQLAADNSSLVESVSRLSKAVPKYMQ